ncbi:type I restriction endonuclease [Lacrimispora sp.]|uniref:type I restriction endonuclease n=1 Tax=Lacrimispora sp. TaxID=2719234 RepID=UPI00289A79F7|nr:type I restriction endonuclease [Lacrimispora sp.]
MAHNENTRVKIPAILHLTRLGYEYVSLSAVNRDGDTNIFTDIFAESIRRINPDTDINSVAIISEIKDVLDYDDLGRAFYKKILSTSGIKLIDFNHFDNNSFHVVTELICKNGEDEFRPDITILINGMPLVFIEVKKPNNHEGILAERKRINARFRNKKFRRFINETQFMIFSNNMEYDDDSAEPIQGAFYASASKGDAVFNFFREENTDIFNHLPDTIGETEDFILTDNNLAAIKSSDEYDTNKSTNKPTNRIITSLLSRERLKMLLQYGIVYKKDESGNHEKHIMRYPQLFATLAIERAIAAGTKKGIVWHTQGSGKTALAYFNVPYLTQYFRRLNIIPKFYFVVDRLDLLTQAQQEFEDRGLRVNIVNNKQEFITSVQAQGAIDNDSGEHEITVVNIQKFSEESQVSKQSDYDLNVQRIYFLDEVHRSYNPFGSFLSNLQSSDRDAIFIGLTGTPLIKQKIKRPGTNETIEYDSKKVFGGYIHKYYYNLSIADGYTLKLIREGIETSYKARLKKILDQIELLKGSGNKREIYAHEKFVNPLADYIIHDFMQSRIRLGDQSIGGMIVCDSSDQAKALFGVIRNRYPDIKTALILHDIDDKETRKNNRDDFKRGKIDLLIVFNMLLTGFDSKRLKKMYLNRVVKDHNLLQTLTRVNRPYKRFRYGFVVDFADIRFEFDKTNAEYFKELQDEIGVEWEQYNSLFKTAEEIETEIIEIKEKLFLFDTQNAERFSEQINAIDDKAQIADLKRVLENAKTLGNLIRLYGYEDIADKLDFSKLNLLLNEVTNRLSLINQKEALENADDNTNLINIALEDVVFAFTKISEDELRLGVVDDFKEQIRKTREAMQANFDHVDPVYITLYQELERIFKKKKLSEMTTEDLNSNIVLLRSIYDRISEQNRRDELLRAKYGGDVKFARVHKRIIEKDGIKPEFSTRLLGINSALMGIKQSTDSHLLYNRALINNDAFFSNTVQPMVITFFRDQSLSLDGTSARQINNLVVNEYLNEYREHTTL